MKILLLGSDPLTSVAAAEQLIELGHNVLYATKKKRVKDLSNSLVCLAYDDINSKKTFEFIKKFDPDYIFSIIFEDKIPNSLIKIVKGHAFNFHPALLPDIRTGDAWYWSVFIATTHSAICVHKLTSNWDSGDIAYTHKFPISAKETTGSYLYKVHEEMPKVIHTIHEMMLNNNFTFVPQTDGTYYPKPCWKDVYIDWTYTASRIDKMVRAGNPNKPARTFFNNKETLLNEVKITDTTVKTPPGTITASNIQLFVATMDLMLEIKVLTIVGVGTYSTENIIELFNIKSGQKFINIATIEPYKYIADSVI